MPQSNAPIDLLVGTYTEVLPHVHGTALGLLACRFEPATGELGAPRLVAAIRNPTWVEVRGDTAYVASEVADFDGVAGSGGLVVLRRSGDGWSETGRAASGGASPATLAVLPDGGVVVANYSGGTLARFVVRDGVPHRTALLEFAWGAPGPALARQDGPHPHQIVLDPATGLLLVPDLGADLVRVVRADASGGLTDLPDRAVPLPAGIGPRHVALHPSGEVLFVIAELEPGVAAFRRVDGRFEPLGSVPLTTSPRAAGVPALGAELLVGADGATLWASTRGSDVVERLAFDGETLRVAATTSSGGRAPRAITVLPGGRFLLAANQDTSTVVVFAIEEAGLRAVAEQAIPTPVCLAVASAAEGAATGAAAADDTGEHDDGRAR